MASFVLVIKALASGVVFLSDQKKSKIVLILLFLFLGFMENEIMPFKHIAVLIDAMDLLFHDDIQSFLKAIGCILRD